MRPTIWVAAVLACLAVGSVRAQLPSSTGGSAGPSRATPLPLSGQNAQSGAVSVQQTAGDSGVNTTSSSIQVGGNFSGSISGEKAAQGPMRLTLADAIRLGLKTNLGPIAATDSARAARAERLQMLSALLPNINVNASDTVSQVNLAAYGFQFKTPPGFNFSIPSVVGPFNYSSLEGTLSQTVYDPVLRRNWRVSQESEKAAILSAKDAREMVVLAVGGTYMQTVASVARVESQRAQVQNAEAVYRQAVVRKTAGTNARIDVTRTLVEFETQQQRLSSLEADLRKQKITLARVIGLPLDRELIFGEGLGFNESAVPSTEEAIERAFHQRADLEAAGAQVRAAEQALSAARAERLPSVSLSGDYGVLGPNPASMHGVFAITGSVSVPIWQGGRTKADIQQAEATLHERQAELADQRGRVEQDVRTALIDLETSLGQVRLAQSNRNYANETLSQARDRFGAGVATTVEVVQAQEQVAASESDYISSLFSFNLARLALARATGEAESSFQNQLKGEHP